MTTKPAWLVLLATCACASAPSSSGGTTPVPSPNAEPCRGALFDADHPDPRCLLQYRRIADVDATALRFRLREKAIVRSGQQAELVLEMQNVSSHSLAVELDYSCTAFEAQASNDRAATLESECGGLCGRDPDAKILQVTLEPGGKLQKRVSFSATMLRVVAEGDQCTEHDAGALPPGTYTLRIALPWSNPVPDSPSSLTGRTFSAPLVVTP